MKKPFAPLQWPVNPVALTTLCLATALVLPACNRTDDADPVPTADTTGRISRIIRDNGNTATNDVDTLDLEYNADGSVHKIIRTNYGLVSTTTFTQTAPNTIVRQEVSANGNFYGKDSFLLDAQGRKYKEYQYNTGSRTYQYLRRYTYRADGRLDYTDENTGMAGTNARITRTWQNGDCIREDAGLIVKTLACHADKPAQPGDKGMVDDLLLWGRKWLPNTHLLQSTGYPGEAPETYTYTWNGSRIQTLTITHPNGGDNKILHFTYAN